MHAVFLVSAVIRPHRVSEVSDALKIMGAGGITIGEAHGFGTSGSRSGQYRGTAYAVDHTPMVRLDVLADGWSVDDLVKVITVAARTGAGGDGRVWVTRLAGMTRVRTGDVGPDAI